MNCRQINNIPFGKVLAMQGYSPIKETGKELWYLSPFREERTPSFKVNIGSNTFFDFGEGIGGTIIDFWCRYQRCDVKTAICQLSSSFSFPKQESFAKERSKKGNTKTHSIIQIKETRPIEHPVLINYLRSRGFDSRVYSFLNEVHFEIKGRANYALGFKNDKGGFELRNSLFKGCSSKALSTFIRENSKTLCLFESFTDFLSFVCDTEYGKYNPEYNENSFIVLNSLALVNLAKPYFKSFEVVKLYLDNDHAGKSITTELVNDFSNSIDCSVSFAGYKDYNEYFCNKSEQERNVRVGRF
ncbi:CHC2 zinc finger domain-containing protein [Bacteroides sp. 224]|uniref:CHC2 zinc finger domain-containing protein n=1 Tax=Bacteroides sp. 224 TaxID=2302936 RepID=UPI0013D869CF|nr:CHC2 zinc finger domain-containing protein [Bacteroides sp. 224]